MGEPHAAKPLGASHPGAGGEAVGPRDVPERVAVFGLGYVGLPLAVAMARHHEVIGIDVDPTRIEGLKRGHDRTAEVEPAALSASTLRLSANPEDARGARFFICAVPTPVDRLNRPDLSALMAATRAIAALLEPGRDSVVVYESTVYPGITENVCGAEIERLSGLKRGVDFRLGYSPERINPGDRAHSIDRIIKVVSGEDEATLNRVDRLYGSITSGGTYRARSIMVAEAAKVIENAQRDINIAFVNETAQILTRMGISIWDVLETAGTKWNFLNFAPGLVGGHCIGVDPYYLAHAAIDQGHDPRVILAGRAINDGMGQWVAEQLHDLRGGQAGTVLILGATFKENVPDIRNSRVMDVVKRLQWLGHRVTLHDPIADPDDIQAEYGLTLDTDALDNSYDLVLGAVPHQFYCAMPSEALAHLVKPGGLLADIKALWRGRDLPGVPSRWML